MQKVFLEISLLSVRTGLILRFRGKNKILIASLGALISFCCDAPFGVLSATPTKREFKGHLGIKSYKTKRKVCRSVTLELNK